MHENHAKCIRNCLQLDIISQKHVCTLVLKCVYLNVASTAEQNLVFLLIQNNTTI